MPRIAEMKTIEGQPWVRLDITDRSIEGSVAIWDDRDVREFKEAIRRDILRTITELAL